MRRLLIGLLLGLSAFAIDLAPAAPATPVTACSGIAAYAEAYLAVWETFLAEAERHPAVYDLPADQLSPEQLAQLSADLQLVVSGLAGLQPPPGLVEAWAIELGWWSVYLALVEDARVMGPQYAGAEYGQTAGMLSGNVGPAINRAVARCPVWQQTLDTLDARTAE